MKTMKTILAALVVTAALYGTGTASAQSARTSGSGPAILQPDVDSLPNWDIAGTNTMRVETYNNTGPAAGTFFPHEGFQFFNEFDLRMNRRISPAERIQAQVFGLFNESEYRSTDEGFLIERASITWEKGDAKVPFRLRAGDHFNFFSLRTIQRVLKGVQAEFQPDFGGRTRHSVQLFSGTRNQRYRDFSFQENQFSGASWLVEHPGIGALSVNVVHNYQDGNSDRRLTQNEQVVGSVAAETAFNWGAHRLTVEGEVAAFDGDHISTGTLMEDQNDLGFFAQAVGAGGSPLTYRLRFEQYGDDYRPNSVTLVPDRRTLEAHASWAFENGLRLRGRVQEFRDAFESRNQQKTQVVGMNLSGAIPVDALPGLVGTLDIFVQDVANDLKTRNDLTKNVSLNLTAPLTAGWTGRSTLILQQFTDETGTGLDTTTRQLEVSADRFFTVNDVSVTLAPGIILRNVSGGATAASDDIGLSLAGGVRRGSHVLRGDYRVLFQDRHSAGSTDATRHAATLAYTYASGPHRVGLEGEYRDQDLSRATDTNGYRLSATYTYAFEKPSVSRAARGLGVAAGIRAATSPAEITEIDIAQIGPRLPLAETVERLQALGLPRPIRFNGLTVFETPVLPTIDQRQRLALGHDGRTIAETAIIIDIDDVGSVETPEQLFERVLDILARRYGSPTRIIEEGDFGPSLAADVTSGRFVRIFEWDLGGSVIRYGIPARLDGEIRLEIQHATRFPPPSDRFWSFENVR